MTSPQALPPPNFSLDHDCWGRLIFIDGQGNRHVGAIAARAFPVSDPDHFVSICDAQGHEILAIGRLADVPAAVRGILEDELNSREFVPVIRRILSATPDEPSQWCVETDRGETTFQVSSEDDVRRVEPFQASVLDSHGIRYLIPDWSRLDVGSRRLLDHFL